MKKIYKIDIDCANCARKVEEAINKMDEVLSCEINFMALKMTLEMADENFNDKTLKKILKTARKVESDFEMEM